MFAGWRDMIDYMRENKIDAVPPQLTTEVADAGKAAKTTADAELPVDKPPGKSKATKTH